MDDARPELYSAESEDARTSRLRHEAALIAEAEQEFAEGKIITGIELERFLRWFGSDEDGPPPDASDAE